jgi:hypothetical protein
MTIKMSVLGLGVFQTPPEETRDAVGAALDVDWTPRRPRTEAITLEAFGREIPDT